MTAEVLGVSLSCRHDEGMLPLTNLLHLLSVVKAYKALKAYLCVAQVTAILVLYGLPWLLTGTILAHECMHAWLRLRGITQLPLQTEEGLCQLMGLLWLESQDLSKQQVCSLTHHTYKYILSVLV